MSVTRQRHRIVVLLSRRESETAVVERDDAKSTGCQTVEKEGVPEVHVSPKASTEHERRASADRSVCETPTVHIDVLSLRGHGAVVRIGGVHVITP
jgi:hypothetical protein